METTLAIKMKIEVFKSTELTDADWQGITAGFNEAFNKEKNHDEQKKYFLSNVFGYSYHAICRNQEGKICAHSSVIPVYYLVQGKRYKFGQSGTSYVLKEYRKDIFLFAELYNALKVFCEADMVKVIAGVSNKNSFRYSIVIAKSTYLKDLDYYILPVSISKVLKKRQFAFFDGIWRITMLLLLAINRGISYIFNTKEKERPVNLLLNDEFIKNRINNKYKKFKGRQTEGIYRMYDEEGIKTAYIMDFRQNGKRTHRALISLVSYIIRTEKAQAILFIGDLQLKQFVLFKVPLRKVPQRFPITIDFLGKDSEIERKIILSPENWDFSLINFDVR